MGATRRATRTESRRMPDSRRSRRATSQSTLTGHASSAFRCSRWKSTVAWQQVVATTSSRASVHDGASLRTAARSRGASRSPPAPLSASATLRAVPHRWARHPRRSRALDRACFHRAANAGGAATAGRTAHVRTEIVAVVVALAVQRALLTAALEQRALHAQRANPSISSVAEGGIARAAVLHRLPTPAVLPQPQPPRPRSASAV